VEDVVKDESDEIDLSAWEPQLPTAGFADRVMARVESHAPSRASRARRWGVVAGAGAALALAAAILLRVTAPPAHGEAIAKERIEVPLGGRALAVLESGASVRWDGDDVVQANGDVFYRVEPGARFTVHTPAGDVEVKGTCFGVKVRSKDGTVQERNMQKRDVKSGVVGGAITALAFVAVYEGKVTVSHASEHASLVAGESAQLGPKGVQTTGAVAEGEQAFVGSAAAQANDEPLMNANQRLVHEVGEYRSRLESISAQKTEIEAKLKRSEETLAASQDGSSATVARHNFDLSTDDWKTLAKDGTVKFRMPCVGKKNDPWSPKADNLQALGLSPQDGAVIKTAYAHSNQRLWGTIKPLCATAVGTAEIAERLGADTCLHVIFDAESERPRTSEGGAAESAMRQVAEMRAGLRPLPGPNDAATPLTKAFLATTGESKAFEEELAQSFGPEEAHRIVFSDELCMDGNVFQGTPKKKPEAAQ
jgi:ferric-dicitrate binding protein FerR (iron transport regulator)